MSIEAFFQSVFSPGPQPARDGALLEKGHALARQSFTVEAHRGAIDKAIEDVTTMKSELTQMYQYLSSLRDGGSAVSPESIEVIEGLVTKVEQVIEKNLQTIQAAEEALNRASA